MHGVNMPMTPEEQDYIKRYLQSQQYQSPEGTFRAQESADRSSLMGAIGSGLNTISRAAGAQNLSDEPYQQMAAGGQQVVNQELARQKSVRDYLANKAELGLKEKHFGIQEKQLESDLSHKRKMESLQEKELDLKSKKQAMELPEGVKESATEISKNIANKVAIAQQIDSYLEKMKGASETTRLQLGRQMIKVLNSTEGKDAVGAEESKRLGSKLEIAFGGLLSGNPGQFGRDIEGFMSDAAATSGAIKGTAGKLKDTYKSISGREHPISVPNQVLSGEDAQAMEWAKSNPNDPRSIQILNKLGVK